MNPALNLNEILSHVKKLNKLDQAALLKKMPSILKESETNTNLNLSDISGLGSSIWHDINIDQYVDSERQW